MPIFEYICKNCGELFEKLIRRENTSVQCPQCGSSDVSKKFSTFATAGIVSTPSSGCGCGDCSSHNCSDCH